MKKEKQTAEEKEFKIVELYYEGKLSNKSERSEGNGIKHITLVADGKVIFDNETSKDCTEAVFLAFEAGAQQEKAKVKIVLKRLRKKWTEIHIKNKNKYISIPENLWDDLEESLLQKKPAEEK